MQRTLLTIVLSLVAGFAGAAAFAYSGLGDARVEQYLLQNPKLLPRIVAELEKQQAQDRLAKAGMDIYKPFDGAILGNPEGKHTLVKFTDYNCGYCRASAGEVQKLLASDPELKVIIREWPIFEGSDAAARMALAAGIQGKYAAFHDAMFRMGDIERAARAAGLDMAKAEADAASEAVSNEIAQNLEHARTLGFTGTPAWIAGKTPIGGAVGYDKLRQALAAADSAG